VNNWTSVTPPPVGPNTAPDFQLSVAPQTLTVKRGACGSAQVTVTPANGFTGMPVFTCAAAAPLTAITCSVSPVASAVLVPGQFPSTRWWPSGFVVLAILLLLGVAPALWRWGGETAPLRPLAWTSAFALVCLLALAVGCSSSGNNSNSSSAGGSNSSSNSSGSSNSGLGYVFTLDAPASATTGSAAVTVTGSIGGTTRTTQLTLTVN
jgi:hypothetical protein